jgi:hypothetical protein
MPEHYEIHSLKFFDTWKFPSVTIKGSSSYSYYDDAILCHATRGMSTLLK